MSADAARKQRRKAAGETMKKRNLQSAAEAGAAAMGDMATGELQSAVGAEAAATGEIVTRSLRSTACRRRWLSGTLATGTMTSNVSVARAATEEGRRKTGQWGDSAAIEGASTGGEVMLKKKCRRLGWCCLRRCR